MANQAQNAYLPDYGRNQQTAPQREPAIHSIMDRLDAQIGRATGLSETLTERLAPICRGNALNSGADAEKQNVREAFPPHLDQLDRMTDRLCHACNTLESIIGRMEF